ncbi:MAG: hypothetical protein BWX73_02491 [Lentisphaerae bacterium ADurb.Bin082]|nr:MAG: hypothetical protein BWX73_02491 [Lentisphaerae bacterium ADurb.Bin082]
MSTNRALAGRLALRLAEMASINLGATRALRNRAPIEHGAVGRAPPLVLSHSDSRKSSGLIQAPFLGMESIMPVCKQNHAQAQNAYDSAENHLKKGAQRPIFSPVPEISPHPPKGASLPSFAARVRCELISMTGALPHYRVSSRFLKSCLHCPSAPDIFGILRVTQRFPAVMFFQVSLA